MTLIGALRGMGNRTEWKRMITVRSTLGSKMLVGKTREGGLADTSTTYKHAICRIHTRCHATNKNMLPPLVEMISHGTRQNRILHRPRSCHGATFTRFRTTTKHKLNVAPKYTGSLWHAFHPTSEPDQTDLEPFDYTACSLKTIFVLLHFTTYSEWRAV